MGFKIRGALGISDFAADAAGYQRLAASLGSVPKASSLVAELRDAHPGALYVLTPIMGYALPNGNGDAVPEIYAETFGPGFIGTSSNVDHSARVSDIVGKIVMAYHREVPFKVDGPRIIGKSVIPGKEGIEGARELQVEGAICVNRNTFVGEDLAQKLLAGQVKMVSQEADTSHSNCSVCEHFMLNPLSLTCAHLRPGSKMIQAYEVAGKLFPILAFRNHANPKAQGVAFVVRGAYSKANILDLIEAVKAGKEDARAILAKLEFEQAVYGAHEEQENLRCELRGLCGYRLTAAKDFQVGDRVQNKIGEIGFVTEVLDGSNTVGVNFVNPNLPNKEEIVETVNKSDLKILPDLGVEGAASSAPVSASDASQLSQASDKNLHELVQKHKEAYVKTQDLKELARLRAISLEVKRRKNAPPIKAALRTYPVMLDGKNYKALVDYEVYDGIPQWQAWGFQDEAGESVTDPDLFEKLYHRFGDAVSMGRVEQELYGPEDEAVDKAYAQMNPEITAKLIVTAKKEMHVALISKKDFSVLGSWSLAAIGMGKDLAGKERIFGAERVLGDYLKSPLYRARVIMSVSRHGLPKVMGSLRAAQEAYDAKRATLQAEPSFDKWLDTFIEEKGIDPEGAFEVEGPSGVNTIPYGVILEHMKIAGPQEQAALKNKLVMLDFKNADIKDFLRHLGKAIAAKEAVGPAITAFEPKVSEPAAQPSAPGSGEHNQVTSPRPQDGELEVIKTQGVGTLQSKLTASWYVGHKIGGTGKEAFQSEVEPNEETHGKKYGAVTGPFNTEKGARFAETYEGPILQTVEEFEEAAHKEASSPITAAPAPAATAEPVAAPVKPASDPAPTSDDPKFHDYLAFIPKDDSKDLESIKDWCVKNEITFDVQELPYVYQVKVPFLDPVDKAENPLEREFAQLISSMGGVHRKGSDAKTYASLLNEMLRAMLDKDILAGAFLPIYSVEGSEERLQEMKDGWTNNSFNALQESERSRIFGSLVSAKSMTDDAKDWISKKITKLREEGKSGPQSVAIAYSMARKEGYDVPEKKKLSSALLPQNYGIPSVTAVDTYFRVALPKNTLAAFRDASQTSAIAALRAPTLSDGPAAYYPVWVGKQLLAKYGWQFGETAKAKTLEAGTEFNGDLRFNHSMLKSNVALSGWDAQAIDFAEISIFAPAMQQEILDIAAALWEPESWRFDAKYQKYLEAAMDPETDLGEREEQHLEVVDELKDVLQKVEDHTVTDTSNPKEVAEAIIRAAAGGSGWGNYEKGAKITDIKELKPGNIYLVHSPSFDADNIVMVDHGDETGLDRPIVYGHFVNPENVQKQRMFGDVEFVIWDYELEHSDYFEAIGVGGVQASAQDASLPTIVKQIEKDGILYTLWSDKTVTVGEHHAGTDVSVEDGETLEEKIAESAQASAQDDGSIPVYGAQCQTGPTMPNFHAGQRVYSKQGGTATVISASHTALTVDWDHEQGVQEYQTLDLAQVLGQGFEVQASIPTLNLRSISVDTACFVCGSHLAKGGFAASGFSNEILCDSCRISARNYSDQVPIIAQRIASAFGAASPVFDPRNSGQWTVNLPQGKRILVAAKGVRRAIHASGSWYVLNSGLKGAWIQALSTLGSVQGYEGFVGALNKSSDFRRMKSLSASSKPLVYRGYTIEESGINFYVKDPKGHRAFAEVPASVETAKKWIDMDIHEKRSAQVKAVSNTRWKLPVYRVMPGDDWPIEEVIYAESSDQCIHDAEEKYGQDKYHWTNPIEVSAEVQASVEVIKAATTVDLKESGHPGYLVLEGIKEPSVLPEPGTNYWTETILDISNFNAAKRMLGQGKEGEKEFKEKHSDEEFRGDVFIGDDGQFHICEYADKAMKTAESMIKDLERYPALDEKDFVEKEQGYLMEQMPQAIEEARDHLNWPDLDDPDMAEETLSKENFEWFEGLRTTDPSYYDKIWKVLLFSTLVESNQELRQAILDSLRDSNGSLSWSSFKYELKDNGLSDMLDVNKYLDAEVEKFKKMEPTLQREALEREGQQPLFEASARARSLALEAALELSFLAPGLGQPYHVLRAGLDALLTALDNPGSALGSRYALLASVFKDAVRDPSFNQIMNLLGVEVTETLKSQSKIVAAEQAETALTTARHDLQAILAESTKDMARFYVQSAIHELQDVTLGQKEDASRLQAANLDLYRALENRAHPQLQTVFDKMCAVEDWFREHTSQRASLRGFLHWTNPS